jgi:hypothetical protein
MPDFPIDPELRVRAGAERVLLRTNDALQFIRTMMLSRTGRPWQDLLQSFEAIRDEWSAIEAVVNLEVLLEAEGLLIEEKSSHLSRPLDRLKNDDPSIVEPIELATDAA